MNGPERGPDEAVQLFGRELERTAIDRLLEQSHRSASGVLVLRGDAGVGKSALLEYALGAASGTRVLRAVGVEPEADLAFAGLHQLLRPVFSFVDTIPDVQAEALRSVFGMAATVPENRFIIALAVLSLLAEVAAGGPVLCLVDDAHWLDHPSTDALAFVARRLEAEGIVMLFAAREGEPRRFQGSGLPEHTVTGLEEIAAEQMLDERFGAALAPNIRREIIEAAGGNPLALLEIPAALTSAQLTGHEAPPRPLPIGHDLEAILLDRARRLPAPAQLLLLVAAAEGSGEADVILSAASVLGIAQTALLDAEASGLIRTEGDTLVLRHPVLRSALYRGVSLPQRQAVHRALVEVLQGEQNADRHAWHRAALLLYPDDEIADELERTAERARSRSGHAAAAQALRRAAELTTADDRRSRRLAAAARAAWDAGRPDEARALVRATDKEVDAETFAELRHVEGDIELRCGIPIDGAGTLIEGADRVTPGHPAKALEMLFDAAMCGNYAGNFGVMTDAGRRAAALPIDESEPDAPFAGLLSGVVAMLEARDTRYVPDLVRALDRIAETSDPRWLIWAGAAAAGLGDEAREEALTQRAEVIARRSSAVGALAMVLERVAWNDMMHGQVRAAGLHAAEGLQHAAETNLTNSACFHRAILAWATAVRGDVPECTALAEEASKTAMQHGLAPHNTVARWAVGLLHLGLGKWESAAAELEALAADAPPASHPYIAFRVLPDLVEAAVWAGRPEVAESATTRFAAHAGEGAPNWQRALWARCRALTTRAPEAKEQILLEALAFHEQDRRPLGKARTLLLLGEYLRRERLRKEARIPLHAALVAFEQLGATPWVDRARRELRATGQTVRRRDEPSLVELTPQERRVAAMVATGASNRDVAAQLFLSPRTVEYHLRSVFTKLGIASRAELIRHWLEAGSFKPAS